jgi:A/G-specific adenine glycosylase
LSAPPFARRLLDWFAREGRHDLPWQHPPSAYRVWVSEVMLQQTQVATVIPYFERFMARFPDVARLAAASLDEVLGLWSGLGYYARARNLHAAAGEIVAHHGGELPRDPQALQALPGIGRSTAAAILALAHDERHAILDGNVKRVLARHAGIEGWSGGSAVARLLWAEAEARTPDRRVAAYTQAIMDLGATLCRRTRPRCALCPVAADCVARVEGRVAELPTPRPRRAQPVRERHWLLARDEDGRVLLQRRPPGGLWGGLWAFPEFESELQMRQWSEGLGLRPRALARVWPVGEHRFTHFTLRYTPHEWPVRDAARVIMEGAETLWYNCALSPPGGLAAPVRTLLDALAGESEDATDGSYGELPHSR